MNEMSPTRDESKGTPTTLVWSDSQPVTVQPSVQLGVYQLISLIGKGGMGTVYRACHTRLKRQVAVKTLHAERLDNPVCIARFQREMEAIGKLDHPNLVRATDAGEDRGIHFLVMEFIEGIDAGRLSRTMGALQVADACEVVRQAALGLQHAHEHGLVHRDVKPSNLMVTQTGQVKVLDLGLALLHKSGETGDELTASKHWMGTLEYVAPEQGQDAHRVDGRADVYSLGCTLFKLLTGQVLFPGSEYDTPYRMIEAHVNKAPPPLQRHAPNAPAGLALLLDRMLAKNPSDRFSSPGEVAAALAPFTVGCELALLVQTEQATRPPAEEVPVGADTGSLIPVTATGPHSPSPPVPIPIQPARSTPRWLIAAIVVGAVLVTALAAGMAGWWPRRSPDTLDPPARSTEVELAPNVWHDLLDRPPTELLWPRAALAPVFEPLQKRLLINCDGMGLLALGKAPAGGYKFQVSLSQTRWSGGIGVFFGYREEEEGEQTVRRYQRLELIPLPNKGPVAALPRFALSRTQASLRNVPGLGWTPFDKQVATHALPPLAKHDHVLMVEVSPHGLLENVLWEGQPLETLTNLRTNNHFTPRDYSGSFGVVTVQGTGLFTHARFLILEKD